MNASIGYNAKDTPTTGHVQYETNTVEILSPHIAVPPR
jgi:hypothetical protein